MVARRRFVSFLLAASVLSAALLAAPTLDAAPAAAAETLAQPVDVTAMPGQPATFSIDASPVYALSWYRVGSTTPVSSGSTSYTITSVTEADDGAQFYASYYDENFIKTQTRTATLTVGTGEVRFATDPADTSVFEGRIADFDVTARGTAPLTYQWQSSADEGGSWTDVDGATSDALSLRPSVDRDDELIRVVVDNPVSEPTPSSAARLTVLPLGSSSEIITDASFLWGVNRIYQGGNPAGNGCNYFSAGTQIEFAAAQGDVRIVHETADGLVGISDGTKCLDQSTTGMQQRVLFGSGEGTANLETGEASIQWTGSFLANAYGGLVPWWLQDPTLTVAADGTGTLTATAGGYGSDMDNPNEMVPIEARPVVVATFQNVTVNADGITVQPDYAGVEVTVPEGVNADAQQRTKAGWGGWPQSFVQFHFETGLSSYWYSSGLSADPDKPPYAFEVDFDGAPPVRELPSITTAPVLAGGPTLVIGRDASVTAVVDDADTIGWERSTDPNGPWTIIDGATAQTLNFTASADWNGTYVRIVATNAEGTVPSAPARIQTQDYAAPSFTLQPTASTAFDGHLAELTAKATGFPAPLEDSHHVEISLDGGDTWQVLPDTSHVGSSYSGDSYSIPAVTSAQNGALIRATASTGEGAVAGSPGITVASEPVSLTVLASIDAPQLAVLSSTPIDPTQQTTLTVIGAGFALPSSPSGNESYSLDLALFSADEWHPGTGGLTRVAGSTSSPNTWIGGGAIYDSFLQRSDGTFSVTVRVPAGALDPSTVYGIGSYARLTNTSSWVDSWNDRSNDAWTPVRVAGQAAAQITEQPENVELPPEGGTARFEIGIAGTPEPTVTWQRHDAGSEGWTDIDGATATVLEVPVSSADQDAAFRAVVDNRLAAAETSDTVTVTVTIATPPQTEPPASTPDDEVVTAPATITTATPATAAVDDLAATGTDVAAPVALAILALLAGAALLALRRRRVG